MYADSLRAVVEDYQLQQFVVVGWSGGGISIRNYLLAYGPAGVRGIVFVASRPDFFEALASPIAQDVMAITGQLFSEKVGERNAAFLAFFNRLTHQPLPYAEWQRVFSYNAANFLRGLSPAIDIQVPNPQGRLFGELLPSLPVLFIQGMHDELFKPELARELESLLPSATLLKYEQSGHSPFLEEQERFNSDIARFARLAFS